MSDYEALRIFAKQPVTRAMIEILSATTSSVIQIKLPRKKSYAKVGDVLAAPIPSKMTLQKFIGRLIGYSNVQTPTLMTSLVYLNRLRNVLPGNAVGMETTRYRIFLASLIISAKTLNDSSPLNKHWAKYTESLLTNEEVNRAERELLLLLKWDLSVTQAELVVVLQPFLAGIKSELLRKEEAENYAKSEYYRLSTSFAASANSLASYQSSKSSMHTSNSMLSLRKPGTSLYSLADSLSQTPLLEKSWNSLNSRAYCGNEGKNHSDQTLAALKTTYKRYM